LGNAGHAAILMAFDPVMASVAAAVFLGEPVPGRSWIGFALGIVGVAVLNEFWQPGFQWGQLTANALILASFLAETTYTIMGKPLLRRSHPVKLLATALVIGSAVNLLIDFQPVMRTLPRLGAVDWLVLAYLVVICTVVGYALWFFAVRETPVNLVATTVFMQPLAGTLFALLLVGEQPRWSQLGGGLLIALGLLISLRRRAHALVHPAGMSGDAEASTFPLLRWEPL
jgi:drug/metabolite transporter (DMT)-like permease